MSHDTALLSVRIESPGRRDAVLCVNLEKYTPSILNPIYTTDDVFMAIANSETHSESKAHESRLEERKHMIERISRIVANQLIDFIAEQDKHNGYKDN